MAWDITSAPTYVLDSIARYVTHNPVTFVADGPLQLRSLDDAGIFVQNDRAAGITGIRYRAPSGGVVDVGMYDVQGALVGTLYHGRNSAGFAAIPFDKTSPGAYIFRLSADSKTYTAKGFVTR